MIHLEKTKQGQVLINGYVFSKLNRHYVITCCVCNREIMDIMDANILEEIQARLKKNGEKEAAFSQKTWPPKRR